MAVNGLGVGVHCLIFHGCTMQTFLTMRQARAYIDPGTSEAWRSAYCNGARMTLHFFRSHGLALLRGSGQILFKPSAITGAVFLLLVFSQSPRRKGSS